jgi:hypothetical protein
MPIARGFLPPLAKFFAQCFVYKTIRSGPAASRILTT